jgi:hypothetical protein
MMDMSTEPGWPNVIAASDAPQMQPNALALVAAQLGLCVHGK